MTEVRSIGPIMREIDPLYGASPSQAKTCREILEYLSLHGPTTKYQVEKETQISHGTIHKCFKILFDIRLIEEKGKTIWRTGLPTITYGLSTRGFLYIIERGLQNLNINAKRSDKTFIEINESIIPLVFGKWSHFVNNGLRDQAESRFTRAIGSRELHDFYEKFFLGDKRARWLSVLKEDPEIKNFCIDTLQQKLARQQKREQELQAAKQSTQETLEVMHERD